jgi:hypothetical protein
MRSKAVLRVHIAFWWYAAISIQLEKLTGGSKVMSAHDEPEKLLEVPVAEFRRDKPLST